MAGIFNIDLSGIGQTASSIGDLATKLRSAIPGQIPPEKQAEIIGDLNDLYAAAQTAQTEIDKVEANSSKLFVAGWRPFIGWVCGAILAYNYLWLFRNSCGCESIIFQTLRHEVEPAEMKKDSHSEALAISKPTGHFLYPLYASVLCF